MIDKDKVKTGIKRCIGEDGETCVGCPYGQSHVVVSCRELLTDVYAIIEELEENYNKLAKVLSTPALTIPETCGECVSCDELMTGEAYCTAPSALLTNGQQDFSTMKVDPDNRPDWCPLIKVRKNVDKLPDEQKAKIEFAINGMRTLFELLNNGPNLNEKESE